MNIPSIIKSASLHILGTGPERDPDRGHLFIVLTNVCAEGKHLLVPVNSAHERCDKACLLDSGDHPFIVRKSFIAYYHASLWKRSDLEKQIENQDITYRGILKNTVFALVCIGLTESIFTAPLIKKYYEANKAN